ncbi:ArsR/SmtB family transcription factor [Thermobrachium celere]|uniref:ArsR/SmtB family transcription factor n=1 Tax=Thermobrachium celere TaxID=53422 RepID=UPI000592C879|nr:metalloregulator ArsR/SmtB family transcription factor [Thermobrachium celere]
MINLKIVDIFKALADENRIKIIKMLACCDMCVCDICGNLNLSQPAVSHHLKILSDSGLLNTTRKGKWIYYSLNRETFNSLQNEIDILLTKPAECPYKKYDCECSGIFYDVVE